MASRPNLDLLPAKARHAASDSWQQTMGTPLSITERLCLAVTAALPHLDLIPVSALLSDEVVERLAKFEFDRLERGDLRVKGGPIPWEKCEPALRDELLDWARAALQAAIQSSDWRRR